MKNITKLPRFMPGQVIDLSYKNKGLPNRILVKAIFIREQNDEWMYEVLLENTGETTTLSQSIIINNMTERKAQVYKCANIINLYNNGWRFCGNFSRDSAHKTGGKYATNRYIKEIVLHPALDSRGCLINDKYGLWIRYNITINSDGTVIDNTSVGADVIVIK